MLAPEIPADIHQLHCVESAPPAPGCAARMGADPAERVLNGHDSRAAACAPTDPEARRHVREEHDIHILENAGLDKLRLDAGARDS